MDLRCFISIELPPEVKENISEAEARLKGLGADVKWINPDSLHITLKFLGSTPEDRLPEIKNALALAIKGHEGFGLLLKGMGAFPNMKHPRVIWAGIEDSERLIGLQKAVETAMSGLGYEPEGRAFKPHLTIGRVRSLKAVESLMKELSLSGGLSFGAVSADEVSLMQSELHPTGARYFKLAGFGLGHAS